MKKEFNQETINNLVTPENLLTYLNSLPYDYEIDINDREECLLSQFLEKEFSEDYVNVIVSHRTVRSSSVYLDLPEWFIGFQEGLIDFYENVEDTDDEETTYTVSELRERLEDIVLSRVDKS